jgi:CHAT domain-containing protein
MRALVTMSAMVLLALPLMADDKDKDLTPERRQELEKKALALKEEGDRQYRAGNHVKAKELFRAVLDMRRALYPKKDYPNGHPDLAQSINGLGFLHKAAREFGKAEALFREALGMYRAQFPREKYPSGHPILALSISNLGLLHQDAGEYGKAKPLFREALAMVRVLYPREEYPNGHIHLAISINHLASLHQAAGEHGKAGPLFREALAMRRALYPKKDYPNGHHVLATSIHNLASLYEDVREYGKAEPLYREALAMRRALYPREKYPDGHPDLALSINNLARLHKAAAEYGKAETLYHEALAMVRALYPQEKYPNGHPYLAGSINSLASLHKAAGEYGKAQPLYREALAMRRAQFPREKYPDGHPDLALSINNLALLHKSAGEYGKAEPLLREALGMRRAQFPREKHPDGHPDLASSINNLASLHNATGEYDKAEPLFREALGMRRVLYPREKYPHGHPYLAQGINNLGLLHQDAGEYGKAEPLFREALAMYRAQFPREKYPNGHPDLATSINNLASLYMAAGEYGKAEPLFREALAMVRALYPREKYPNGHPELAQSINNLAFLQLYAGEYGQAETLFREALGLCRVLYPNGHPDLANSINSLGFLHQAAGKYGKAEPFFREALGMYRDLYPREKYANGHPDLALSINNLASLHRAAGEYGKAETLLRKALGMFRVLYPREKYPNGHPDLARSIFNLGDVHWAAGEHGKAETLLREALGMYRDLLLRYAGLAAEAECLNFLANQPLSRDFFLSATRHPTPSAAAYDALWDSRASITRLQERRHRDLMASRDKGTRDLADQLRQARGDLARRLLRPLTDADQQRAEVQKLTDAKEDLEKRIARKLKVADLPSLTTPPLKHLIDRLPHGSAFIDFYRYMHFEQDPKVKGKKGEKRTPFYVAFIVRPGRGVVRVELNEAAPIERAWAEWHKAITVGRPDEPAERRAAAALARLVWEPLRAALPDGLKTVYLTADGDLHQVPWAALPGRTAGSVLLDEHAVCLVPHGPFLLARLEEKRPAAAAGTLLAVGGIDYDDAPATAPAQKPDIVLRGAAVSGKRLRWPALDGTARERRQVAALARLAARLEVTERSGQAAGTEQLQRDLPGARYAHLATHGFFADPKLRSALQIDPKEFERVSKDRRSGARSPLAMSGLVFAGANRGGKDMADDRGILTAEGLIGLRLEGMELAVLSACETGLGAWGGGEGVYGLQRAFHVAGCRDVVASLWKVDDDATHALMALFYRNLWEKKLDPAQALRQAQLTLYRHPEAVALAKKRGAEDFSESDLPKVEEKPAAKAQRAPTAQWAAFTISGVRPVAANGGWGR